MGSVRRWIRRADTIATRNFTGVPSPMSKGFYFWRSFRCGKILIAKIKAFAARGKYLRANNLCENPSDVHPTTHTRSKLETPTLPRLPALFGYCQGSLRAKNEPKPLFFV